MVQDTLHTHTGSAFYECLPARQAHALAARFRFVYPPQGVSWLTPIERDCSALRRQGLKRRLASQAPLAHQGYCRSHERQAQRGKSQWPVTIDQARQTRNSQYRKGNKANKC